MAGLYDISLEEEPGSVASVFPVRKNPLFRTGVPQAGKIFATKGHRSAANGFSDLKNPLLRAQVPLSTKIPVNEERSSAKMPLPVRKNPIFRTRPAMIDDNDAKDSAISDADMPGDEVLALIPVLIPLRITGSSNPEGPR